MSTRGLIAIEKGNGMVNCVYSHYDNYLNCNGVYLHGGYKTSDAVKALLKHGSINSLGKTISDTVFYGDSSSIWYFSVGGFVKRNEDKAIEIFYLFKEVEGAWYVKSNNPLTEFRLLEHALREHNLIA